MSAYNGSGTFVISGTGLPVVTATTISSTVANQLNTDLATGLSTAICKDGQTTPTANIPMGGFKITGIALATALGDALSYGRNLTAAIGTFTGLVGTTTNDDAAAGQIGEYISSGVARGGGAAYTTTVTLNITTVALTAGDWDVTGFAGITVSAGTITQFGSGAGSTPATFPTIGQNGLAILNAGISISGDTCATFAGRISLAAPATIYLLGAPIFTGTATAYGFIGARRAR